jgi:hypothetical protein
MDLAVRKASWLVLACEEKYERETYEPHARAETSCGNCMSRAKSSAPKATAATRGLAEQMEAAFITPRAVSIHGIMQSRWLKFSDASIQQSSESMLRTSSAL